MTGAKRFYEAAAHLFSAFNFGNRASLLADYTLVLENGLNARLFFAELFANRVSGSFGMDIFVSTTVLLIFAWFETARLKLPKLIFIAAFLGTFGAGVSCGFPLFLYLRQKHIDNLKDELSGNARDSSFARAKN